MSWLSKAIYKLYNKENREQDKVLSKSGPSVLTKKDNMDFPNPTYITLYKAVGGHIVKFRSGDYDEFKGSSPKETVYIINDDEDLQESLALCITAEALKNR